MKYNTDLPAEAEKTGWQFYVVVTVITLGVLMVIVKAVGVF